MAAYIQPYGLVSMGTQRKFFVGLMQYLFTFDWRCIEFYYNVVYTVCTAHRQLMAWQKFKHTACFFWENSVKHPVAAFSSVCPLLLYPQMII